MYMLQKQYLHPQKLSFLTFQERQSRKYKKNIVKCDNSPVVITREKLIKTGFSLFSFGFITGPPLDGILGRVYFQTYDALPINFAGLRTSGMVPILMGIFYVTLGFLTIVADQQSTDVPAIQKNFKNRWKFVALNFGILAALLELGAFLFQMNIQYSQISIFMAFFCAINWYFFDGTRQGLVLAMLCGIFCPASEIVLDYFFSLWHYQKPDVLGIVSWVVFIYFFWTPFVSNLGRSLWTQETL